VQRLQALRGTGAGVDRQLQWILDRRPGVGDLQALAQVPDIPLLLAEVGARHLRLAEHAGHVAGGARGQRGGAGLVLAAAAHRRLRAQQGVARLRDVGGGVLVGVGRLGAGHRLLRGGQFGGGRRQAGAAGKCEGHRKAASEPVPGGDEVCEAWAHGDSCCCLADTVIVGSRRRLRKSPAATGIDAMDIGYFLKLVAEKNASDMFLTSGAPVNIKVEGELLALGNAPLPAGMPKKIAYALMTQEQVAEFERELELNMAIAVPNSGRFRVNVFQQRGETAMVIRAIRSDIPSIEELQLPQVLKDIIMAPRGLVLIVGSTGAGKSTTLASMIDHRNSTSTGHILTIEDPIEYLHRHKKSIVNQREVGLDTHSFHAALKNAMREAPDVILIGEIRDEQTMDAAIAFAETGHICLATLHSNNAD